MVALFGATTTGRNYTCGFAALSGADLQEAASPLLSPTARARSKTTLAWKKFHPACLMIEHNYQAEARRRQESILNPCSPASSLFAALRPCFAGLRALTPACADRWLAI